MIKLSFQKISVVLSTKQLLWLLLSFNNVYVSFKLAHFYYLSFGKHCILHGGIARVALDEVLKDDKMGLRLLGTKYLEVTLIGVDRACPCPNVTAGDGPLVIMGEVRDGVAMLDAGSYVRAASEKRVIPPL